MSKAELARAIDKNPAAIRRPLTVLAGPWASQPLVADLQWWVISPACSASLPVQASPSELSRRRPVRLDPAVLKPGEGGYGDITASRDLQRQPAQRAALIEFAAEMYRPLVR